jgi:hypothetical protein
MLPLRYRAAIFRTCRNAIGRAAAAGKSRIILRVTGEMVWYDCLGVRPAADQLREAHHLLLPRPMPLPRRFAVPLDLSVNRVAQPQPLVAKLVHVLGVRLILRSVDAADRLEKTQRKESIDCGKHAALVGRRKAGEGRMAKLAV